MERVDYFKTEAEGVNTMCELMENLGSRTWKRDVPQDIAKE